MLEIGIFFPTVDTHTWIPTAGRWPQRHDQSTHHRRLCPIVQTCRAPPGLPWGSPLPQALLAHLRHRSTACSKVVKDKSAHWFPCKPEQAGQLLQGIGHVGSCSTHTITSKNIFLVLCIQLMRPEERPVTERRCSFCLGKTPMAASLVFAGCFFSPHTIDSLIKPLRKHTRRERFRPFTVGMFTTLLALPVGEVLMNML